MIGSPLERFQVTGDGLDCVAESRVHAAELAVHVGEIGAEHHGPREIVQCAAQVAEGGACAAEIVVRLGCVRIQVDGSFEQRDRFLEPALGGAQIAEIE